MRRWFLHKKFEKRYAKLPQEVKARFKERRDLFLENPFDPRLNNHSVDRAYPGCRSINVTGDYRAIFSEFVGGVMFVNVGTHAELYG